MAFDDYTINRRQQWVFAQALVGFDCRQHIARFYARTDGQFTEVLSGLKAGDSYVVENSFLLKADLEKSGASHDH